MILRPLSLSILVLFLSLKAQARVFNFDMETVAPYLNFRSGLSSMTNDPFRWQNASSYGGDEVGLMYGGEFGIYFRGGGTGFGLGVLVHTHDPVEGGTGSSGAGTLYSVDTESIAYGPLVFFDIQMSQTKTYNWKLGIGAGYQFMSMESTYNLSAAGQALVTGNPTSIVEKYKGESAFAQITIGTEFHLSGTTTMNVTAGYHYVFATDWTNGSGGSNFTGSHIQGSPAVLENGSAREIDWSYPFLQLGFQFYVDTVR